MWIWKNCYFYAEFSSLFSLTSFLNVYFIFFIYDLFKFAASISDSQLSNGRWLTNEKLKKMLKEAFMDWFEMRFQYLPRGNEMYYEEEIKNDNARSTMYNNIFIVALLY